METYLTVVSNFKLKNIHVILKSEREHIAGGVQSGHAAPQAGQL